MTMSYYEPQGWQAPAARQVSWEHPVPPSRSGSSSVSQREDIPAFSSQFDGMPSDPRASSTPKRTSPAVAGGGHNEKQKTNIARKEVDRAIDNLVKSGKLWAAPRRDSMPLMMGRPPYSDYGDSRLASAMAQRHHSISEFDNSRGHSSPNAQGFYASQRFQNRPNEVEQMMQAKRRMAAQRERELRNYHQEQQYNRSLLSEMSGNNKPDRSNSPAAVSEESRRDLLARQHRALYGNESPAFFPATGFDDGSRPDSQGGAGTPSSATGVRGASPRGIDPFGLTHTPGPGSSDSIAHTPTAASALQSPTRANSASSPNSGINPVFGKYGDATDPPVTSTSSPGGAADSPSSRQASSKPTTGPIGSVGPIGSRPIPTSAMPNPALNKRSTTPLPSPLGFGFTAGEAVPGRTVTAHHPPASAATGAPGIKDPAAPVGLGWGNGNGVWGSKNGLGVQASVWG